MIYRYFYGLGIPGRVVLARVGCGKQQASFVKIDQQTGS